MQRKTRTEISHACEEQYFKKHAPKAGGKAKPETIDNLCILSGIKSKLKCGNIGAHTIFRSNIARGRF